MKRATFIKTLSALALSTLALASGASQAHDQGRGNPWLPDWPAPHAQGPNHGYGHNFDRHDDRKDHADVDARQRSLFGRIQDGIASGRISPMEARDLFREQRQIEFTQRRFLADGRLDRHEWFELDRMLDDAAAHIRAEKRDGDWRGVEWRGPAWR